MPELHKIIAVYKIPKENSPPLHIDFYWPTALSSFSKMDSIANFKNTLYEMCNHHVNIELNMVDDEIFAWIITKDFLYKIHWDISKPWDDEKASINNLNMFLSTVILLDN